MSCRKKSYEKYSSEENLVCASPKKFTVGRKSLHRNGAKRVRTLKILAVSGCAATLFHKLINTCVENFTEQKYCPSDSASLVLAGARAIL